MATADIPQISIKRIATETMMVPIIGTAPLIVHRFAEKAKRQVLDGQQGRKSPKELRDPEADYEACFYRLDDGAYGIPTLGLKAATVTAANYFGKDVPMTMLKRSLFFEGETNKDGDLLNRLTYHTDPIMREDVVRYGMNQTDLRYRPQFSEWATVLNIRYVKSSLTRDSVLSVIDAGGMGIGVGEWRPEKGKSGGQYGTFMVDPEREIEVVK